MIWQCKYCDGNNYSDERCVYCGAPNPLREYILQKPKPDVFMDSIKSSFIEVVGYDDIGERLVVRLRSGNIYEYQNVPKDIYLDFKEAASKGSFYAKHIKGKFKSKHF